MGTGTHHQIGIQLRHLRPEPGQFLRHLLRAVRKDVRLRAPPGKVRDEKAGQIQIGLAGDDGQSGLRPSGAEAAQHRGKQHQIAQRVRPHKDGRTRNRGWGG